MSSHARVNVSFSEHGEVDEVLTEVIGIELEEQHGLEYNYDGWYLWRDIKWSADDEDLIAVSKKFPEIVFEARVYWLEGESCPEYSVYYLNGKHSEKLDELRLDPEKIIYSLNQQDILNTAERMGYKLTNDQVREVARYIDKGLDGISYIEIAIGEVDDKEKLNSKPCAVCGTPTETTDLITKKACCSAGCLRLINNA